MRVSVRVAGVGRDAVCGVVLVSGRVAEVGRAEVRASGLVAARDSVLVVGRVAGRVPASGRVAGRVSVLAPGRVAGRAAVVEPDLALGRVSGLAAEGRASVRPVVVGCAASARVGAGRVPRAGTALFKSAADLAGRGNAACGGSPWFTEA